MVLEGTLLVRATWVPSVALTQPQFWHAGWLQLGRSAQSRQCVLMRTCPQGTESSLWP